MNGNNYHSNIFLDVLFGEISEDEEAECAGEFLCLNSSLFNTSIYSVLTA